MSERILKEEQYQEYMETVAEPFLQKRQKDLYLEREPGKAIHCAFYRADKPRGVVVISHGFTESAEKYKEGIYYLVKARYHVWIQDHCGHGYSYRLTKDPSMVHVDSYERYVEDLLFTAKKCAEVCPDLPLFLYGHSMGGGIAAACAAEEAFLFSRVILSSPMICPSVGKVPWIVVRFIAFAACRLGLEKHYVWTHGPYRGAEKFERSSSTSRPRYEYYQKKRAADKQLWTNGASFGWLRQADLLNRRLMKQAWKEIQAPVLLIQAGRDTLVSEKAQRRFLRKLNRKTPGLGRRMEVPGSRHEIYGADSRTVRQYWRKIFQFLEEEERVCTLNSRGVQP